MGGTRVQLLWLLGSASLPQYWLSMAHRSHFSLLWSLMFSPPVVPCSEPLFLTLQESPSALVLRELLYLVAGTSLAFFDSMLFFSLQPVLCTDGTQLPSLGQGGDSSDWLRREPHCPPSLESASPAWAVRERVSQTWGKVAGQNSKWLSQLMTLNKGNYL